MRYDFRKVQRAMVERGWTFAELAARTAGEVEQSTICKAFKRGTAHPSTAKALCRVLRVSFKDIVVEDTNGNGDGIERETA